MIMYGAAGAALGCESYANDIQGVAALDIFILEYPGYEDRPGSPSQYTLFSAADEAFQTLPTNRPIYLVGGSLGTGVAAYLAGTYSNKVAGVILLSPYNRFTDLAQDHYSFLPVRLLLVDRFPSEQYLRSYHGKVAIMVDGRDDIVPEKFGLRLYNGYAGPKKLWEFPGGWHCDIMEPTPKFWREVVAFLQTDPSSERR